MIFFGFQVPCFFLGPAFENHVIICGDIIRCRDLVPTENIGAKAGEDSNYLGIEFLTLKREEVNSLRSQSRCYPFLYRNRFQ